VHSLCTRPGQSALFMHVAAAACISRLRRARGGPGLWRVAWVRSSVVEHSAAVRMVPGSNPGVPSVLFAERCVEMTTTPCGTRTRNLWIRGPTRYPLRQGGTGSLHFAAVPRSPPVEHWCPERVGTALKSQPLGGTAVVQNGLAPSGSRDG
jgi:hypothetical protein